MFGCTPVCFYTPYVCTPPYVWMPSMFGHTSVWLDDPTVWIPPCIFGCLPYVWLYAICLDAAKCIGVSKGMRDIKTYGECTNCPHTFRCHYMFGCTPCMFGYPHMFGSTPVCLDTSHVCTFFICSDAPECFGAPMFVHLSVWLDVPHVWTPPVCVDAFHMFGGPLYVSMLPNVWGHPKI